MWKFLCMCDPRDSGWAGLILRLAVGIIFLAHGYQKWTMGVESVAGFFGSVGIPAALAAAWFVTSLELVGGAALILGLFTHWFAKLFAIEMAVAFFFVHVDKGIFVQNGGYELVMLLFAASVSLVMTGGGKWSLGRSWMKK